LLAPPQVFVCFSYVVDAITWTMSPPQAPC